VQIRFSGCLRQSRQRAIQRRCGHHPGGKRLQRTSKPFPGEAAGSGRGVSKEKPKGGADRYRRQRCPGVYFRSACALLHVLDHGGELAHRYGETKFGPGDERARGYVEHAEHGSWPLGGVFKESFHRCFKAPLYKPMKGGEYDREKDWNQYLQAGCRHVFLDL